MRKEIITREAYILRLSPYKESDMMVTAFGADGLFSFLARGIRKMTSKNASSCQILCHGLYSLASSADGKSLTLTEAKTIEAMPQKEDLLYLASLSFLSEASLRFLEEENASVQYGYFVAAMDAIHAGYPIASACLLYFASLLRNLGYGLQVDGCVKCGKKEGIVAFSYEDGGFLCEEHAEGDSIRPGSRSLKILRYAFRYGANDFGRVAFEDKESIDLLNILNIYAEHYTGIRLKSLDLLTKCAS